jgi:uncharacterized Zn finger protein (UPF0148 family)
MANGDGVSKCAKCGIVIERTNGVPGYCAVCEDVIRSTANSAHFVEAQQEMLRTKNAEQKKWPLMKAVCDKCGKVHGVLVFYALSNELLCLSCAGGPERTMTIQQIVAELADALAAMSDAEKAEARKTLDAAFAPMKVVVADAPNPNVNVLELTNADYQFLREMKVRP